MYMGGVVCICVLIKLGINRDYDLCVCVCNSVYFTIINSNVQHSKCFTKAANNSKHHTHFHGHVFRTLIQQSVDPHANRARLPVIQAVYVHVV